MNIKAVISVVSIILILIGYAPYIRDIFKGKTRPHVFSWFIWGLTTSIAYALQVSAGAGVGAWTTLVVVLMLITVFFLGLKNGDKNIKKIDIFFLVASLITIPIWLIVKQPILSIILLALIEMLGFMPTIRKAWNNPYSETLSLYTITTFRHGLTIFALEKINIITVLYPATWVLANGIFAVILIFRRKKIPQIKQ